MKDDPDQLEQQAHEPNATIHRALRERLVAAKTELEGNRSVSVSACEFIEELYNEHPVLAESCYFRTR